MQGEGRQLTDVRNYHKAVRPHPCVWQCASGTCVFANKMSHVPSMAGVPIWLCLAIPRQIQGTQINGQMNISTQVTGHRKPPALTSSFPALLHSEGSITCLMRETSWTPTGSTAPFPPKDLEQRQSSLSFYSELGAGLMLGQCAPLRLPWLHQAHGTWTFDVLDTGAIAALLLL